jgi:hypothetical protein
VIGSIARLAAISASWIAPCSRGDRALGHDMREAVAAEQHRLEEQHADRPHRGRSAEPRQDRLADQRLHEEEQERVAEDHGRVERCEHGGL